MAAPLTAAIAAIALCASLIPGCGSSGGESGEREEREERLAELAAIADDAQRIQTVQLQQAVEACAGTAGRRYDTCDSPRELGSRALFGIRYGTGRGEVAVLDATRFSYTVAGRSRAGTLYSYEHTPNGIIRQRCAPAGRGECGGDGRWQAIAPPVPPAG